MGVHHGSAVVAHHENEGVVQLTAGAEPLAHPSHRLIHQPE